MKTFPGDISLFARWKSIVLHELNKQRNSDVTGRHYRLANAEISLGSLQLEETVEIQASFFVDY